MKTAVLYLRVSTPGQVNTDYDPEGISIPAQRQACERKALQLDVEIVDEYVEPGKSATTIDKRPIFQQMLQRLKNDHDVDYVIVYNLSRLNRNRVDDARVLVALRACGVTLISAQENIDETPAGQLMHGILAAFNEYRSTADGADIRYKMGQKVKHGGTVGQAKLGYLNVRDQFEGREIRTNATDPDRAPFVTEAFKLFATRNYALRTLAVELTERGLRTRATARRASKGISTSKLGSILRDRYYLGIVTYQGEEYPGRHEPLTTDGDFTQVQVVLDSHSGSGTRQRLHSHYLRGLLYCGQCRQRGVDSRLIFNRAKGNGGEYDYFFCGQRREGKCQAPFQSAETLESEVHRWYTTLRLPPELADRVRTKMNEMLADQERSIRLLTAERQAELRALDEQEANLLDLAAGGTTPTAQLRARLKAITERRAALATLADEGIVTLEAGAMVIFEAIELLTDPAELYRTSNDENRRIINQAFFERLYVEDGTITNDVLAGPFDELVQLSRRRLMNRQRPRKANSAPKGAIGKRTSKARLLERGLSDHGSNRAALVEVAGIEPCPTLWNRREPLDSRTKTREPSGSVGKALNQPLTPSTAAIWQRSSDLCSSTIAELVRPSRGHGVPAQPAPVRGASRRVSTSRPIQRHHEAYSKRHGCDENQSADCQLEPR
jgi:DNA invertase Pin-like site-specific DNA recombinase